MKRFLTFVLVSFCIPVWAQNPVSVHITDSQKVPVAGASVEARLWTEEEEKWVSRPGETDQSGDVTLDLPRVVDEKRPVGLWIVAKGYAFSKATLSGAKTEVKLEKGAVWRGKVVDEVGKPIEGARIIINGAQPTGEYRSGTYLFSTRFAELFVANTGADGSFEIADVPAMGLLYNVSAPRYAAARGQNVAAGDPARIQLVAGGAFTGKLLGLDGKPLAKIRVFAQSTGNGEGYGTAETSEEGIFTIESLAASNYNVMVQEPEDADYIVAAQENVSAEKGKTIRLPDFRAVKGVLVTGIVRDAVTQKGVAGAGIGLHGPHRPASSAAVTSSQTTGADGKFSLRVLPGRNKFYFYQMPKGYVRSNDEKNLEIGQAPAPLVFELRASKPVRGMVIDESRKPLAASIKLGYDTTIKSGADGKWEFTPQEQTTLELAGGDGEDGYFEVISPRVIDALNPVETTIIVRKKDWQVLPGRVLKADGTPLQGAKISASFFVNQGNNGGLSSSQRTVISNENGDFVLPQIRAGADAQYLKVKAEKSGYVFQKGGEISKNGPVWRLSDFVFVPLDRKVEGTTTPGAHVVTGGREIVADAAGKFEFENLAAVDTPVYAAKDGLFGAASAPPLKIELQKQGVQGVDEALARAIWTEVVGDAAGKEFYAIDWVTNRLTEGGGNFETQLAAAGQKDMALVGLGIKWAGKVDAGDLEKALSGIKDPDKRLYAYLSAAGKANDAALGQKAMQEAETILGAPEKEIWWREMNLYRTAVIATRFVDEKAGFAALDRAVAFTLKNHGAQSQFRDGNQTASGRDDMFALQAEVVAEGSLPLLKRLMNNIEPGSGFEVQALGNAIPVLAKNVGVDVALPLLDELEEMPEPERKAEQRRADSSPDYAFGQAVAKVVPLLEKSPAKAVELARRIQGEISFQASALASAAHFYQGEEAAKLWREAVTKADSDQVSRYAAGAFEVDPVLGRELFKIARDKVEIESGQEWRGRGLWANFAFYYARVDAAQARLILEREWGLALQKKSDEAPLGDLARAMSAIDGKRAWEMARSIPADTYSGSLETRRKIGQYLAASEEKRRNWSFERWGRGDTWDGEEE